jgi:hypothetical protein
VGKKIVSLLYNKEKASNAFFGTNVNKSVYLFVYGFRLTFAVFMDGNLPNSFSAASFIGEQTNILHMETYLIVSPSHHLLESRRSYFIKPYFCDVPRNIQLPLKNDHGIAGPHRIIYNI